MENKNNNIYTIEDPVADMLDDIQKKKSAIYHPPVGKYSGKRLASTPKVYTDHTIQLGKPITFEDFKTIPTNMKKEYMRDLKVRYPKLALTNFSIMLGIPRCTLLHYLKTQGINHSEFFNGNAGHKIGFMEDNKKFFADMGLDERLNTYGKIRAKTNKKPKISSKANNDDNSNKKESIGKKNTKATNTNATNIPASVSFNTVSATINAADIQEFVNSLGIKGTVTITISI